MSVSLLERDELLREKEELIHALTERLELTAEQLDRLQRTSGDRGRWLADGIPAELIEQQQSLCGELDRAVRQWEAAQPTLILERIEARLDELMRLARQASHPDAAQAQPDAAFPEAGAAAAPAAPCSAAWETLKAELMAQEPAAEPNCDVLPEPASTGIAQRDWADPFDAELSPAPDPVELETADRDTLRDAVLARDEFIAGLLQRLRSLEMQTRPTDGWKVLEAVPEELRNRLESLERRLEKTCRLAEVEMSLERAKLGREAMHLKHREAEIAKILDRSGETLPRSSSDAEKRNSEPSGESRWLRMLGLAREW